MELLAKGCTELQDWQRVELGDKQHNSDLQYLAIALDEAQQQVAR